MKNMDFGLIPFILFALMVVGGMASAFVGKAIDSGVMMDYGMASLFLSVPVMLFLSFSFDLAGIE